MDKFLFMERQTLSGGGRKIKNFEKKKIPQNTKRGSQTAGYISRLFSIISASKNIRKRKKKEAYY
jgi:hypothetical protein